MNFPPCMNVVAVFVYTVAEICHLLLLYTYQGGIALVQTTAHTLHNMSSSLSDVGAGSC